MKILIMGLPGAGKTTLAAALTKRLTEVSKSFLWLNADEIRTQYNDWDFSYEGRLRQSQRMKDLAISAQVDVVIADFVAPLVEMRDIYDADYLIWVDTIERGRFEDTNKVFVPPVEYDLRVTDYELQYWVDRILGEIQ